MLARPAYRLLAKDPVPDRLAAGGSNAPHRA